MGAKIRLSVLLIVSYLLAAVGGPAQAQTPTPSQTAPLIGRSDVNLNPSGDLWAWYGPGTAWKQLTDWHYNDRPFISPDGKWVAYRGVPQYMINHTYTGPQVAWVPFDMWLLNLDTGKVEIIAGQPPDEDGPVVRSWPTWSPDSRYLAWTELGGNFEVTPTGPDDESNYGHLIVYDMQTRKATTVSRVGASSGDVPDLAWGEPGIAVQVLYVGQAEGVSVQIFSPDGKMLIDILVPATDNLHWVKDGQNVYLMTNGYLFDPKTGDRSDAPPTLEIYSPTTPSGITLTRTIDPQTGSTWQLADPGKGVVSLPNCAEVAIAPDGKEAAYATLDGDVYVYLNGKLTQIESQFPIHGIAWGLTA